MTADNAHLYETLPESMQGHADGAAGRAARQWGVKYLTGYAAGTEKRLLQQQEALNSLGAKLQNMAEWLGNSVSYQQSNPDSPPEPGTEFDSHLLQASEEVFAMRDHVACLARQEDQS